MPSYKNLVDRIKDNGERNERGGRGRLRAKMKRTERTTYRGKGQDIEDKVEKKEGG
jgi:hypothetical protein